VGELTRTGAVGRAAGGIPGARSGTGWLDAAGTDQVQARFSRSLGLPEAVPDILGLELIARGWPAGEAKVVIALEDLGTQCRVTIAEDAVRGPGLALPKAVRDPLISVRNTETLKRLELMAAGGAGS
jgi:hypothetical protein